MSQVHRPPRQCGMLEVALMRLLDILLAALVLLFSLPLYLLFRSAGRLVSRACPGLHGRVIEVWSWQPAGNFYGRLGRACGLSGWPRLWQIVVGDLSWVGPRLLPCEELSGAPEALALRQRLRPGLFSLWQLRQRTSIDYGDALACDLEQVASDGFAARLGILVRSLLASLYGRPAQAAGSGRRLIDTLRVESLTMDETLAAIECHLDKEGSALLQLAFVNADCVNVARRDSRYRQVVNRAGLVLPDGIGMRMAGRLLGQPFRQNVNGTDLFPRLCQRLDARAGSVYLLGARPGVAAAVADKLRQTYPRLRVLGSDDGYFTAADEAALLARIHAAQPDVLLVAMGAPRQECWIAEHAEALGARVAIGVGGLFDFVAGCVPRAPQWVRELGLEWAYRLLHEPRRLWRRYVIGNLRFLLAIYLQKLLGSADSADFGSVPGPLENAPASGHGVLLALAALGSPLYRQAGLQPALMPLGELPCVVRCIETLVSLNCQHIDLIADEQIAELSQLLGDGERWGCQLRIHRVASLEQGLARLAHLPGEGASPLWLARADHWLPASALQADRHAIWAEHDGSEWAGWARLDPLQLAPLANRLTQGDLLPLAARLGLKIHNSPPSYCVATPRAALLAQSRLLRAPWCAAETVPEIAPGMRVSPLASISPTAELRSPLFIGAGAVIGDGAVVGPNALIGAGAIVEAGAEVHAAIVQDKVYVSRDAQVVEAIATPSGVLSSRWQIFLPARQTIGVIGALAPEAPAPVPLAQRAAALLLFALFYLPGKLLAAALPEDFSRRFMPGLRQVMAGRYRLFGAAAEIIASNPLPSCWQERLQQGPAGLLSPSLVFHDVLDNHEAAAWADLHCQLNASTGDNLRLLAHYFRSLFNTSQACQGARWGR